MSESRSSESRSYQPSYGYRYASESRESRDYYPSYSYSSESRSTPNYNNFEDIDELINKITNAQSYNLDNDSIEKSVNERNEKLNLLIELREQVQRKEEKDREVKRALSQLKSENNELDKAIRLLRNRL